MKSNYLISIVVPAYNVSDYLKRCLDTLVAQTYKNYEVIIVDDGSTDETGEIADQYAKKYSQITCIHKENAGLGKARNTGIKLAKGDYITFVDSDDFVETNFLEKSIKYIQKLDCDTVITSYYRIYKTRSVLIKRNSNLQCIYKKEIHRNLIPRLLGSLPDKNDTFAMSAWGIIYDLGIIKKYNISFVSERLVGSEDIMFNMEYLAHSICTVLTDYAGYDYCENKNSLTTSYNPKRFFCHKELYKREKKLIKTLELPENTNLRLNWQFFIHLTIAIRQEINNFGLFSEKTRNNINLLLTDPLLIEIINNYPINKTDIKHRIFLYAVKNKWSILVCLLVFIKGD